MAKLSVFFGLLFVWRANHVDFLATIRTGHYFSTNLAMTKPDPSSVV